MTTLTSTAITNSSATLTVQSAVSTTTFVASIGVNTAMDATTSGYGNLANVEYALSYLGISNVRDAYRATGDVYLFQQMYSNLGIKFDFYLPLSVNGADWEIAQILANPSLVAMVEGPNETDTYPTTYGSLTGMAATHAEQSALYTAVTNSSALNNATRTTPVIQASFAQVDSFSTVGNWSSVSNYGNSHQYFDSGLPPGSNINTYINLAQQVSPGQKVIATEAGYYTLPSGAGVSPLVQAKYDLTLLFDDFQAGIPMTYLFDLIDEHADPSGTVPTDHFGLFTNAGAAKPVATALHNLVSLLSDSGASSGTASLAYGISGLPTTGHSMLMSKSDGTFVIAVWNDATLWNSTTASEIQVAPVPITLSLGQSFRYINVYDPLTGVSATASFSNASQVALNALDHPILITLSNNPAPQLALSEPAVSELVSAGQASGNLWGDILASVTESNSAYVSGLTIQSVNTTGSMGTVVLTSASQSLIYTAAAYNPFDTMDTFGYTVTDGHGGTVSGTVRVAIVQPASTTYGMMAGGVYAAPSAGWTMYSEASGQTLIGSAQGQDTFYGLADTTIAAYGTGNIISATAGNHIIATGSGNAKVTLGAGSNQIYGAGSGDVIISGAGNSIVMGGTGATTITLGDGNQAIGVNGAGNTISIGVGTSMISAGSGGNESVTVAGGSNQIFVGGTGNFVHVVGGTNSIGSSGSNSRFQLDAGTNTVSASGTGNTITGGNTNVTIWGSTGATSVSLGGGNDQISLSGAGNTVSIGVGNSTIDAGSGGNESVTVAGGTNQISVGGSGDYVHVVGGTSAITASGTQARFRLDAGNATISAAGTGNVITGGNGNTILWGPTGSTSVTLGNGNNQISLTGVGNTVTVGTGTNAISAGSGNATVTIGGGTNNEVYLSGANNSVTLNAGSSLIYATSSTQSSYTAIAGTNTIYVEGTSNTITGGSGNDTIIALSGSNRLLSGAGTDQIQFAGSSNTILVGKGATTLYDSGSSNTIQLAAKPSATTQIYGSVMTNSDTFDLRTLLASTTWNGTTSTLGSYLSFKTSGSDAILSVNSTGAAGGSTYAVADFHSSGAITLSQFLTHAITQ